MKRETIEAIRVALAGRKPGTWTTSRDTVFVPFGDPQISPAFLEYAAAEKARDLAEHQRRWDKQSSEDCAAAVAAGFSRDVPLRSSSDHYGGDLVCESVCHSDAILIASAPAWLAEVVAWFDENGGAS